MNPNKQTTIQTLLALGKANGDRLGLTGIDRRPSNARATRIKLLVHDSFGMWCAARRQNQGGFIWPRKGATTFR